MTTSPQHVSFQTTDYDQAGEYLTRVYGTNMHMTGGRVGYSFRFTQLTMSTFSVGTAAQTDEMAITVESPPSLFIVRPHGTIMDYRSNHVEHKVGAGELFIASASDVGLPYRVEWVDGVIEATALPFDLLRQVAATDDTVHDQPVRFTDLRPYNRAATRHLAATIDYLIDALRDRPEIMAEPLVASASGQQLCAAVLSAFPNTARFDPTIEDRHDSHPRTLRRAIAYIDDHANEEISVADIAAAANVTIRALQHAFRRHRDTTPMGYVRQVRLRQAHRELLATDPTSGVTVTQVAARWGFFHPGRFARYYREAHGNSPYQTLLRDAP
ncbi:helix-turn-helix transcriptional regulator [Actinophytocola algeriensis]|uniref:AraC-like DNA-binding protein n=1 Tax=Actinophytocola algeriensis TaxID=1768010 RepID=A0A7W7VGM7_9PSEU|nr:helix-turn-helix transcriptional regulator [Actinophytocola algeriensis]MBB4909210.1 AraC-like DNA-binding protein [Actinophytocola algeriensis]MBE1474402.1 AraC-like DNA-binding protein [Actinophytocola algeriensis]